MREDCGGPKIVYCGCLTLKTINDPRSLNLKIPLWNCNSITIIQKHLNIMRSTYKFVELDVRAVKGYPRTRVLGPSQNLGGFTKSLRTETARVLPCLKVLQPAPLLLLVRPRRRRQSTISETPECRPRGSFKGRPLIIWGAWSGFSRTKFFFFRRASD